MNKEIKHLYQELTPAHKEALQLTFKKSPRMLRYIQALDDLGYVSTQKAIQLIYSDDTRHIDDATLMNRFYKLRRNLHLHLLQVCQNNLKSSTDEEIELKFLQLLSQKNEHAYLLERAQKLEKKCWEDNLFELLPDLLNLIISALHFYQPENTKKIAAYIEKLDQANDLLYTLYKFKNYTNTFRLQIITANNYEELATHYSSIINKMRRKANLLKPYARFNLIYHYTGFLVGSQLYNIVYKTGNVLSRHLNQLEKLLAQHPHMPIVSYIPNHRVYSLNSILINRAVYWYQKGNSTKSYESILQYEQLIDRHSDVYIRNTVNEFHNILLCCWGAKEYNAVLKYAQELKTFQSINSSIEREMPYYIYEMMAYTGLYPKKKHTNPLKLIALGGKFLKKSDQSCVWMYEAVGSFALVYGFFEQSRYYLEHPLLLEFQAKIPKDLRTVELLNLAEADDKRGLHSFLLKIKAKKKEVYPRTLLTHFNELEMLTKLFL